MGLWKLRSRRRLISWYINHRVCILNDLPHILYLFWIFSVMCPDHGQVTTLNYFKKKKKMSSCFDVCTLHTAFCLASSRHCPRAALMGPESLKPWNYSIRTYSLPRISSPPVTAGGVRRSRTRVICSRRAESNGTQPDTKDVSRGRGKANKKKRSEGAPPDIQAAHVHRKTSTIAILSSLNETLLTPALITCSWPEKKNN